MDLHQIVYSSRPAASLTLDEVDEIVVAARKWNAVRGITGRLLVVTDDAETVQAFMQWIEGPTLAIQACIKRIAADPRHHDLAIVQDTFVARRSYPEWSMAHETVASDRVEAALAAVGLAGRLSDGGDLVVDVEGEVVGSDAASPALGDELA